MKNEKSENISNVSITYNPWENSKNFIQDTGNLNNFINFLDNNNICTQNPITYDFENLNILKQLDFITKLHFEKLTLLENLYEKYRYELILSKDSNHFIIDKMTHLIEILQKFDTSKIKIANLLHNTNISSTDNNTIKIKHNKKFEFLKILKTILSQVQQIDIHKNNELELIELSSNIHPETINKLTQKYDKISNQIDSLLTEYDNINKLII